MTTETKKKKPRVAFFDFASCEGCQLHVIQEVQGTLGLLSQVDVVEFREAISEKLEIGEMYDIAFIEGSITRDSDIPRLKQIRERAKLLITIGACSTIGGINALKNFQKKAEYTKDVYPEAPDKYETTVTKAICEIVKVDAFIPGCPIDTGEFLRIVRDLLIGRKPFLPTYPVCMECKKNENCCVYERGEHCLGPVTRAGCNARCIGGGGYCFGCRGLIPDANFKSMKDIMQKYNLSLNESMSKFELFLQRNKEIFPEEQEGKK